MARNNLWNYHNIPVVKCSVDVEPSGVFQNLNITTQIFGKDVFQNCTQPIDIEANMPPKSQKECSPLQHESKMLSTNRCSGEIYNEDFFRPNKDGDYYYRHKVLFNLYSFDKIRSKRAHKPTLEIDQCEFKYFLGSHQALIQVETNNMGILGIDSSKYVSQSTKDYDYSTTFYGFYGEDRGAQIRISNSTFTHSKFCRGLIFSKARPDLAEQTNSRLAFYNFTLYGATQPQIVSKNNTSLKSFIILENSVFRNLAQSSVIQSLATVGTIITNNGPFRGPGSSFISGYATLDQGLILNVQGFRGDIEVRNCTIDRNMAYINNIYNPPQPNIFNYLEGSNIKNSLFYRNNELNFLACIDKKWGYLHTYYSNPYTPFNDEYHFLTFESISVINTRQQFGSIIIVNNTFTDNIGTVGGAINIDNMVFLDDKTQASLVIKKNKFIRNMAYFAGNAFQVGLYLRMTKAKTDAEQMCGAAILIEDNLFQHNTGTKQHSGGSGLIQCIIHEKPNFANSGIQLSPTDRNLTDPLAYTGLDYDNPANTTRNVTDLYDTNIWYPVLKYGTQIRNNKFVQNFAGIQGTALKLENINELQVIGNVFQENGPVTSLQERLYSPYFNILVNKTMTITFSNTTAACINEYAYYHQCNERGYHTIDQPVQGALYIFSCHQENTCFGSASDSFLFEKEKNKEELQQLEDWHKRPFPYQNISVSENFFNNNQANLILSENHQVKQASSIFIKGGKNVLVNKNQFLYHNGLIAQSIKKFAYDLYSYFGQDFFQAATAPIIVVEYSYSDSQSSLLPNTTNPYDLYQIQFLSNQFKYNSHYQSLIIPTKIYQGALIVYDSNITTSQINFSQNYVGFNKMLGPNGALIHIKGGILNATANLFEKNGYVSTDVFENHPESMHVEFKKSYLSWLPFSFPISQDMGLFFFEFNEKSIPVDRSHLFENNTFTQSFCISGCVFSMGGAFFQQFAFINNRYSFIVGSSGVGAVTSTSRLAIARYCPQGQLFVQTYQGETFNNMYGGAIYVTEKLGQHVTIIKDSVFYNNFGDEGAAISITNGGLLLITNTTFRMDEAYLKGYRLQNVTDITSQILHSGEDEPALTTIYNLIAELNDDNQREIQSHGMDTNLHYDVMLPKISKLLENFSSFAFPANQFISRSVLEHLEMIKNDHGQIRFDSPMELLKNYNQPLIGENGISLRDFCINVFGYDPVTTRQSVIKDSQFHNLFGQNYSAISIYSGRLLVFQTPSSGVSFTRNVALTGSPIFADKARFELQDIQMINNYGLQGGCILIGRCELQILRSLFQSNKAYNGGVIFVSSQSKVYIDQCTFLDNLAYSASVMLSVDNKKAQSLQLSNSIFRSNYSYLNLFSLSLTSMQVTSCEFTNNFAFFVNHGFSILLNSKLEVKSSVIKFTDGVKLNKLFYQQMYGFFFVMLQSKLTLSDQTQIKNIQWGSMAAVSLQSQSSLFIQNGVTFFANNGYAINARTIDLVNAQDVSISDAYFEQNSQENIVFTNT